MEEKRCSKCNNELIECATDLNFTDGILVKRKPDRFRRKKKTVIVPFVCANCGFTEWYAEDTERLKR